MISPILLNGLLLWLDEGNEPSLYDPAGYMFTNHQVIHTFLEISAHLLGVTPTRHRLEYLDHAGAILTEPVRIKGGHAVTPERPGSGREWNEEMVRRGLAP